MYAKGMESFLQRNGVLNKDFKDYVIKQSQLIVEPAEQHARSIYEEGITYISSSNMRKEALAHDRQRKEKIEEGLIGVWSCVESCNTFKATFSKTQSYPELKYERSKCKHLYFYFDDPTYGFMNIRLQTQAPYEIQIAIRGKKRAIVAIARMMLTAIYHMFSTGEVWNPRDLGNYDLTPEQKEKKHKQELRRAAVYLINNGVLDPEILKTIEFSSA